MKEDEIKGSSSLIPESPWSTLAQAALYLAFGVILAAWPSSTLKVLYTVFGIFALGYGVFVLLGVFLGGSRKEEVEQRGGEDEKKKRPDWVMVPVALAAVIAGVMALAWPNATSTVVLVILGVWAIGTGVIEVAAALRLPKGFNGRALILLVALVSIGFGVYFILGPEKKGAQEVAGTVVVIVGVFGIVKGVLLAVYAFMLRKLYGSLKGA